MSNRDESNEHPTIVNTITHERKNFTIKNSNRELNVRVATGAWYLHPFDNTPITKRATDKDQLTTVNGAIEKAATSGATSKMRQGVGIGWLVGRSATLYWLETMRDREEQSMERNR